MTKASLQTDPGAAALARSWLIAEDVIARAATDGERVVSLARLVLALAIIATWPLVTRAGVLEGQVANLVVILVAAVAAAFSGGMLWYLRSKPTSSGLSLTASFADASFVLLALSTYVASPPEDYFGIGRVSGIAIAYLVLLAAGVRLSRRGIIITLAILLPGIVVLMVIDEAKNAIADTLPNRIAILAVLLTSAILAWLIATRTKALVAEGASQALLADRARGKLADEVRALGAHLRSEVKERSATLSTAIAAMVQRSEPTSSLLGTVIDGRFRIDRLLGSGGMGAVYEGRDVVTDAAVAIKVMSGVSVTEIEGLHRFLREARAAAEINHPGVVRVLGVDVSEDGLLFQVLERVDGISLDDKLRATLLTPAVAARAGSALCSALAAAHAAGVIHRDVKPANVMLTRELPGVKLLDFGVAKLRQPDASGTGTGKHIGTPAYMAPEQIDDDGEISERVDVYAVGLVLCRMVTGVLPSRAKGAGQLLLEEGVPTAYSDVVVACLAEDPVARPTAADLVVRLAKMANEGGAPELPAWYDGEAPSEISRLLGEAVRTPETSAAATHPGRRG